MTGRTFYAHRGLNRIAPENTIAAFRAAADRGVRWIEADVDVIADGTPIVIHDSTLDRTTNAAGSYYDLSRADVAKIDAGAWFGPEFAGERLPLLADLVDFMNETGMNANIEIKANEAGKAMTLRLVDAVIDELERLRPGIEVLISSFSQLILQLMRDRAPKLPRACLYEGRVGDDWRSVLEILECTCVHPEDWHAQPDGGLAGAGGGLTREQVQAFRAAGYGVNVWTVNDRARAEELFSWGATGIFTDVADVFVGHGPQ